MVVMVMEHHQDNGGPIWWKNAAHKHYCEDEAAQMVLQVLHIVKYMHDHKFVHGDCECRNKRTNERTNDDDHQQL